MPIILFANLSREWGGGEKWFLTVGLALRARGHDVRLLVYPGSVLERRAIAAEVPCYPIAARTSSLLNPVKLCRLKRFVKRLRPEAVMLNASHELKVIGLVAHWAKVPKVIFRRGVSYAVSQNPYNRWVIRHAVTHFLANSNATFDANVKAFPSLNQKKHLTAYNAIDLTAWQTVEPAPEPGLIVMSARLSPEKGIERAIEAMRLLKRKGVKAHLLILGEGPELTNLQELVAKYNLQSEITFAGFLKDIRPQLKRASIFLFTPHFGEGTSIALIEAMALGIPCVAFETPAMNEVIIHGETGFLAPDGDIEALSGFLQQLLTDEAMRQEMGKKAQLRAEKHFSFDRLVGQVEGFLEL